MPVGIMTISTATAPEVHALRDDPQGLSDYVDGVVTRAGARLINLYFDIGEERAYALVEDLDDYRDVKAVSRILGGESFLKMVKAADAAEAVSREPGYRGT
jgi:hypothetical protein